MLIYTNFVEHIRKAYITMVKVKTENLTPFGLLVNHIGLSLNHIIEKSGVTRSRLNALRTKEKAVLSFQEARLLAPVLRLTLDELANEIDRMSNGNS